MQGLATHPDALNEPVEVDSLVLDDVLQQFQREARNETFDNGRYRCSFYEWGSGPPLVFVHGLSDDRFSFLLPVARLAKHFRCIAYDLPTGQGDGAKLGTLRFEHQVQDLLDLLDHLKIDRSYLFGSSFGSTIVLSAMYQQPRRFPRAVLQGGFAYRPLAPAEILLARFARFWPGRMGMLPLREHMLRQMHLMDFDGRDVSRWKFFLERTNYPPIKAVARRALMLHELDLRSILPHIHQPILLVCGEWDPLVDKNCEQVLLENLPNAQRVEIAKCGHLPYFSHPEVLAEVVLRFLTPLPCHVSRAGNGSK